MIRHARVLFLLVASVITAVAIGHLYSQQATVQAQSSTNQKPWKVLAITPDPEGAAVLEGELMKGGWTVQSVTPAQYNGARTIVVLKNRIISD